MLRGEAGAATASQQPSSPRLDAVVYLGPDAHPIHTRTLLDTGAEVSVMDRALVNRAGGSRGGKELELNNVELCSPLGGCQKCSTLRGVCVCVNNEMGDLHCFHEDFVVIEGSGKDDGEDEVILSYDTIKEQGLFRHNPSLLQSTRRRTRTDTYHPAPLQWAPHPHRRRLTGRPR